MAFKSIKPVALRYSRLIIILLWVLSAAAYVYSFGFTTTLEAEKYINEANNFIDHGSFSAPRFWFYSITIFINVIAFKLHTGLIGSFILQGIFNLSAYLLFFKAMKKIFSNELTALILVCYLLLFWPYQSWIAYLYSESAFFSAILILIATLILYPPTSVKNMFMISAALFIVVLARPLGVLLIVATCIYLFVKANKKWRIILAFASIVLLCGAYAAVNIIMSSVSDWDITKPFRYEFIICELYTNGPHAKLDLNPSGNPMQQLVYYLTHNFSHFTKFTLLKLKYFFLMTRSYYSSMHNLFLLINIIPLYLFAIIGIFKKSGKMGAAVFAFIISTIVLYTLTIVFQCDDYHNRFVLSIFPLFAILAAKGLENLNSLLFKNGVNASGVGIKKSIPDSEEGKNSGE